MSSLINCGVDKALITSVGCIESTDVAIRFGSESVRETHALFSKSVQSVPYNTGGRDFHVTEMTRMSYPGGGRELGEDG